nr:3-oxo-delta(4,5)-steroid 5-beta-reductase [Quercus suber]
MSWWWAGAIGAARKKFDEDEGPKGFQSVGLVIHNTTTYLALYFEQINITTSNYTINSLHKEQTKGLFHKLQRTSFNFLFDFLLYQSNLIVDMHPFSSFKLVNA